MPDHMLPGWPEEPPYVPAVRKQPQVVHHHHYPAPPPVPDVRTVLAWTAVGGVSVAALLAMAMALAAVVSGLAALALGILALVFRGI
ncbi:hypothetical protein [Streptacidiphilus sp. PAMC 29251]